MTTIYDAATFAPSFPAEYIPAGEDFSYVIHVKKKGRKYWVSADCHMADELDEYLLGAPNGFRDEIDAQCAAMHFAKEFALTLAQAWADEAPVDIQPNEDGEWVVIPFEPQPIGNTGFMTVAPEVASVETIKALYEQGNRRTAIVRMEGGHQVVLLQDYTGKVWAKAMGTWKAVAHALKGMERDDISPLVRLAMPTQQVSWVEM